MKPQAADILNVLELRAGHPICGVRFVDGTFGFTVFAYSQRIGELRKAGHRIESRRCQQHGHAVHEYRWIGGPE